MYICNDVRTWATWNHYPINVRIQEKEEMESGSKERDRRSGQDGNQRQMNKKKIELRKKVMESGEDKIEEDLADIQKTIEDAAGKVAHHTEAEREKMIQNTPENVRLREEAAARCTKKIERRVFKQQARKARAEHLVKCCLELGKTKAKKEKALTELYVKGNFTEDREEWQKELQRHCDEVYNTDQEENERSAGKKCILQTDRRSTVQGGRKNCRNLS